MIDPLALISLMERGVCEFSLPEWFFDLDYPGQYMRRIKSVTLTIPCVTGPYTSINCLLTLVKNSMRKNANVSNATDYPRHIDQLDTRFADNIAAIQSIATSNAQNDSGLFELNFRDERYLPFEGAGLVDSQWKMEMTKEFSNFDFNTISDVLIRVSYTAKDGGESLKSAAKESLRSRLNDQITLQRMFSTRHEFPSEWYRFLNPGDEDPNQVLHIDLSRERFPFQFDLGKTIILRKISIYLKLGNDIITEDQLNVALNVLNIENNQRNQNLVGQAQLIHIEDEDHHRLLYLYGTYQSIQDRYSHIIANSRSQNKWTLEIRRADIPSSIREKNDDNTDRHPATHSNWYSLNKDVIEDIGIVCDYTISTA